jgi:acyl dehydratase
MNVTASTAAPPSAIRIGMTRDSEEFRTSSHRLAQFAQSVDDTNPAHLAGGIASPVFAHVPVMQSMVEVLTATTGGFALHGEHDFVYHRPIVPGQRLFSRSTLIGVHGNRAGTTYVIRSETATPDGAPVVTQYSTCLVRGPASTNSTGDRVPARPAIEAAAGESDRFDLTADQTRRYADAARDYSPYTIDPAAAALQGFAAPLVHGMCTLAMAARAIVDRRCGGDTARLARLGCRFANPLLLTSGQQITVAHWKAGDGLFGFEAMDRDGSVVIRNGYAEVKP